MDLDAFPDGIIVAGPDERVILVNRRARHMGCMAPEIGMHLHDAMPFDDLHGNHWFTCTQPYGGLTIRKRLSEQSWWAADGREFLIDASLVREIGRAACRERVWMGGGAGAWEGDISR